MGEALLLLVWQMYYQIVVLATVLAAQESQNCSQVTAVPHTRTL